MSDEWAEFSKRLAAAMRAAGHESGAAVLHKQFNSRYGGQSIAFQTAYRWLNGEGIPRHDKLLLLAKLYKVDPCLLQFGEISGRDGKKAVKVQEDPADYEARELFDVFRSLPVEQRKQIGDLIRMLASLATPKARSRD
jgi:transcriptional regulator with XRE-family HTH domain